MNRFDNVAAEWDDSPRRQNMTKNIISALKSKINLTEKIEAADFGTGTGLLLIQVQPFVKNITGFDNSKGMLDILSEKLKKFEINNVETSLFDADKDKMPENKFDLFFSGMAFHHVVDTQNLIIQAFSSLKKGGEFFIADLVTEDGSFHGESPDVHHLGFDMSEFSKLMKNAGFENIECKVIFEIEKESGHFPVFGAYGKK
jgi:ubiquinone/menaquinone biosynthesis C-methylase UbiE